MATLNETTGFVIGTPVYPIGSLGGGGGGISCLFPSVRMLVGMTGPLAMMVVTVILAEKRCPCENQQKKACRHDVAQQGHGTYPYPVAIPCSSLLIPKIQILANPIPMLNLMVGMMAICAVGVSIRWHHF
jgi:hypothetical protein